jgi:hypothetical protein
MQRLLAICLASFLPATASARTLTLTADDCEQIACLSSEVPRMSWAVCQHGKGVFDTSHQLQLRPGMAVLLKFPLDKIPREQRILKAELSLHVQLVGGGNVQVRRLLADWGDGVCHDFRKTLPEKQPWTQAGGRGAGTDRAAKDSAIVKCPAVGEHAADVTEDVELWYTQGAANRGWIMTLENEAGSVYLASPYAPNTMEGKQWKLQITFEPE